MAEQHGLDLAGPDPETAALDQVDRFAPDDAVHPVTIDRRDVTGVIPPVVGQHLGRGVGTVEIAVEQRRARHVQPADRLPVVCHLGAVLRAQPGANAVERQPHRARPALPVHPGAERDQRFRAAVALHRPMPAQRRQPVEDRHRQRRAARHQQPRRRQRPCGRSVLDDARPHRRHPEQQRPAVLRDRLRVRLRRGFAGVHEAVADAQRPEQSEDQTVHVVQRQTVHQGVRRRPLPGLGQHVDVGGDRAPAHQHALRQPGGPRGVDDQRGRIQRRFGVTVPRPGVQPHRDVTDAPEVVGLVSQPRLRARIGEDVAAFGGPDVGRHGHDGHPGDQAARDRQHGGRGGPGQHGDLTRAGHALGHRRRRPDQIAAAQGHAVDAHGVADVGAGGDGRGVQGVQQHGN